jgi:flagellar basal-body rod protein FlgG
MLATDGGQALRAAISVPADASALTIASDGTVRATVPNSSDAVELGQITLARLDDATGVEALDGGLYRVSDDTKLVTATPGEDGTGIFAQGSIERSNVSLNDEMVQLMLVQRAYAANAQIVQAADQLMAIANGLRR